MIKKKVNFYSVIIGTELLNGRRRDAHFSFLNQELLNRGWEHKASFLIEDDINLMLNIFKLIKFDPNSVMFCFGGIGSTPDDHTRKIAAQAFTNNDMEFHKTALENITTPLTLVKKMPKEEADKIALDLLEKVGVLEKKDAYPETLSGGEKQRVGIARALAVNPDIILFDEPTSALDPELVAGVLDVIKDLAKQHTTMLIVTHEMKFAKNVADEVVFMEGGHIVEMGLAHEVFENPKEERTRQFLSQNNE